MISHNPNSVCGQMEPYYFDILQGRSDEPVPTEVSAHIRQCDHCQAEIRHLSDVLSADEPDDRLRQAADNAVTTSLALQFAYMGESVTCDHVKPFLPSMADAALETRVPTPITVHLDNCRQCANDLETIRRLRLSHKQLCRLGQLFAEKPAADPAMCAKVQKTIPFMGQLHFAGFPADVLKHMCLCRDCRHLLHEERSSRLKMQKAASACNNVCAADIFDYVIPYGIEPSNEEYAKFHASFVSHITSCHECLGKIQDLHNTLFQILERPASDVVTKFEVSHSAKTAKDASSLYANWPINVQITHKAAVWGKVKERFAAVNLRPFIKPAAAAAVILFALVFYFNTPMVQATDLAQIYQAVAKIANVHIASFVPDKAEPTQQTWVAKTLNISIFKTPTEMILWDIPNSSRRVKNLTTGIVEKVSLSDNSVAAIEKNINGSLGLLPFEEISELPNNAKWEQVPDSDIKSVIPDTKVYDLLWVQKDTANKDVFKKWRVFVNTKTYLPQRVEWYEKAVADKDYSLESYTVVTYLSEPQIQAVIKDTAF